MTEEGAYGSIWGRGGPMFNDRIVFVKSFRLGLVVAYLFV